MQLDLSTRECWSQAQGNRRHCENKTHDGEGKLVGHSAAGQHGLRTVSLQPSIYPASPHRAELHEQGCQQTHVGP